MTALSRVQDTTLWYQAAWRNRYAGATATPPLVLEVGITLDQLPNEEAAEVTRLEHAKAEYVDGLIDIDQYEERVAYILETPTPKRWKRA